ncbi:hypothetical protein HYT58_01990, partial [Candidatus Woesearchaeota archaeon]|nr:hypothetical protein [Candidatus Woesearchaeota archaeon]
CSQPFNIDRNNDGEADFIEDAQGNKKNINYYCDISTGQSLSTKEVYDNLGQNCDLGTFSFADEKKKINFMNPGTGGVTEKEVNKGAPITCTGSGTSS